VTGDLALDQLAERDAHRSGPRGDALRRPGLVAHLHTRHPFADSLLSVALLTSLLYLSTAATHACNVFDALDSATVYCVRGANEARCSRNA
jgi:hypothetical protein